MGIKSPVCQVSVDVYQGFNSSVACVMVAVSGGVRSSVKCQEVSVVSCSVASVRNKSVACVMVAVSSSVSQVSGGVRWVSNLLYVRCQLQCRKCQVFQQKCRACHGGSVKCSVTGVRRCFAILASVRMCQVRCQVCEVSGVASVRCFNSSVARVGRSVGHLPTQRSHPHAHTARGGIGVRDVLGKPISRLIKRPSQACGARREV